MATKDSEDPKDHGLEMGFVSWIEKPDKPIVAFDLWWSQMLTRSLTRELPRVRRNFRTPVHAFRRLGYLASLEGDDYRANVIYKSSNKRSAGLASIQRSTPGHPDISPDTSAELSFWHRSVNSDSGFRGDSSIVNTLALDREYMQADKPPIDLTWMVTLPGDFTKAIILEDEGFEPLGSVQKYDLDDLVDEPRQLWVRTETPIENIPS